MAHERLLADVKKWVREFKRELGLTFRIDCKVQPLPDTRDVNGAARTEDGASNIRNSGKTAWLIVNPEADDPRAAARHEVIHVMLRMRSFKSTADDEEEVAVQLLERIYEKHPEVRESI